jgi:hypothetical protein
VTIKNRVKKLENQLIQTPQLMPEGLSPMEQYLFMINSHGKTSVKVSAGVTPLTPEQAYASLIGSAL